jgi:hypothetical protein
MERRALVKRCADCEQVIVARGRGIEGQFFSRKCQKR